MEIKEIKECFDLLLKVNADSKCTVSELTKELSCKKTILMKYILENPKLFETLEVQNKPGLYLKQVYISPEDNYLTQEWLNKQIKDKAKHIYVLEWDNYGVIEGYYVEPDIDKHDKLRYYLWRNTLEKIYQLEDLRVFKPQTFFCGGYSDCSHTTKKYGLHKDSYSILENNGWIIDK